MRSGEYPPVLFDFISLLVVSLFILLVYQEAGTEGYKCQRQQRIIFAICALFPLCMISSAVKQAQRRHIKIIFYFSSTIWATTLLDAFTNSHMRGRHYGAGKTKQSELVLLQCALS